MAHLGQVETVAEPSSRVERRLDGIEAEMREVRGFLERLVRVEERRATDARELNELRAMVRHQAEEMRALMVNTAQLRRDVDGALETLTTLSTSAQHSAWVVGGMERLWWIGVTAVVGLASAFFGARLKG